MLSTIFRRIVVSRGLWQFFFRLALSLPFSQLPVFSAIAAADSQSETLNLLSFNIRYDNPEDGENAWSARKENVASLIRFHQADMVGLQEALLAQLQYLDNTLSEYTWFGVGRDDGNSRGEHTAIMYRKDKFELLDGGSFWCSPTPEKPSKGWGADYNRTVTWGNLKSRRTGTRFFFFNTHFSHVSQRSRVECAKLIRKKVDALAVGDGVPIVVTGDFNATPETMPYQVMTDTGTYRIPLYDSATLAKSGRYGTSGTFTGFDITADAKRPIDYIFVNREVRVRRFGVLSDSFDGRLPSDHYPLLVDITFR